MINVKSFIQRMHGELSSLLARRYQQLIDEKFESVNNKDYLSQKLVEMVLIQARAEGLRFSTT